MSRDQFTVTLGSAGLCRIFDDGFLPEWMGLYNSCPWATGGQHPVYVRTNLRFYQPTEIAVIERHLDDRLVGFCALGRSGDVSAPIGWNNCEYNGWLCAPELSPFMPQALRHLWKKRKGWPTVTFRYVPHEAANQRAMRCIVRKHSTNILPLTDAEAALRFVRSKKSLRSLANQIGRLGSLSLRFIESVDEFIPILDSFATIYDARKLAKHGSMPFHNDPKKRQYLVELMRAGLQHVTALTLGDELVAAHIGLKEPTKDSFRLAGIAHNEKYAKFSPGSLLLANLVPLLIAQGYKQLDLTPGDDEYKERWGTRKDTVYELSAFPSTSQKIAFQCKRYAAALGRRVNLARIEIAR